MIKSKKIIYKKRRNSFLGIGAVDVVAGTMLFGNAAFDIKGVAQYFDNDKVNAIAERIFQLFFTVQEVNGKYEATLDGEKVAALFTELKTITVEGLFIV